MAQRNPHATWSPLGVQTQPKMTAHDVICLHTMAGTFAGTKAMFLQNGYGGTESTYGISGSGHAEQWQDRAYTADANLDGNPRVISIETADMGEMFPKGAWSNPPWTQAQLEAIALIVAWECSPAAHRECPSTWACHRVGIPLVLMTRSDQRGVGYHRLGVDGNFPSSGLFAGRKQRGGGEKWSNAAGKACPGDARIAQMPLVIEMAKKISTPKPVLPATGVYANWKEGAPMIYHAGGYPSYGVYAHNGGWVELSSKEEYDNLVKAGVPVVWVEKKTLDNLIVDSRT